METSFFQETDSSWEHWNNNGDLTLLELVKTKRCCKCLGNPTLTKSVNSFTVQESPSVYLFPFLQQMFNQVYNNSGSSIIILASGNSSLSVMIRLYSLRYLLRSGILPRSKLSGPALQKHWRSNVWKLTVKPEHPKHIFGFQTQIHHIRNVLSHLKCFAQNNRILSENLRVRVWLEIFFKAPAKGQVHNWKSAAALDPFSSR